MQTMAETATITVSPAGVLTTNAQASNITFYLVQGLNAFCQIQQLSSWCWAAAATTVQNFYTGQQNKHLSAQSDICVLSKGKVVNEAGNAGAVLNNNLKYGYVNYAEKNSGNVNTQSLLQFLSRSVTDGTAMTLDDGTSTVGGGHTLVVLGYGEDTSVSPARYYLVYFDPYLGFAFPGSYTTDTFNYAPFENFLGDLNSGTDKLYKWQPGSRFMTPLLNAIPKDSSWSYPVWHVVNGKCDSKEAQQNIPKDITSGGVTYCAPQSDHKCASGTKDLYYYPRMTLDADPLSLNTFYACSVDIKRAGHSYKDVLNYGVSYTDPHNDVIVTDIDMIQSIVDGAAENANLEGKSKDFYLYLIPMSKSLIPA